MTANPYRTGTHEHRIWQQGADATNDKWRQAIVGKLPATKVRRRKRKPAARAH